MPAFRFQGKRALLTYSRVGDFFTADALLHELIPFIGRLGNEDYKYRWAIERHHDELTADIDDPFLLSFHIHFLFDLGKDCTERGNVFDYEGFHPNVIKKGGKTQFKNAANYLKKDGWWGGNLTDEEETINGEGEDIFAMALNAKNYDEYCEIIIAGNPKAFITSYMNVKTCGKDRFQEEFARWTPNFTLDSFTNIPLLLTHYTQYILSNEAPPSRPRGLIIISPSRYGKTEYCRSITPSHGYMSGEWNPDEIPQNCDNMIFDDIPMSELIPRMRWKHFFGLQKEFNVTGKYRGSRKIVRSWKAFIYLTNTDPRQEEGVNEAMVDYININCDTITLENKLYNN